MTARPGPPAARAMGENAGVTQPMATQAMVDEAIRDEAIKKAAVAWIRVADGPALALWCLPLDGALCVISGPGEQAAPGLAAAAEVEVTLRGDHGGRVVAFVGAVERILPETEQWATVAPQLATKRLNAPGSADALVQRWIANDCAVVRITAAQAPALTGAALPDTAQAEPPRETPARVPVRRPLRLHRVRRR